MDLNRLFHPESIAVIGASPHLGGGKMPYYQVLQLARYKGRLYPVNPKYTDINGVKVYPSLDDLPGSGRSCHCLRAGDRALETVEAAARRKDQVPPLLHLGLFRGREHRARNGNARRCARAGARGSSGPTASASTAPRSGVTCDIPKSPITGIGNVALSRPVRGHDPQLHAHGPLPLPRAQ